MTSHLTDLPNASDFGESFNYDVWTPQTQIKMCNVPWNSDYRDIVKFDTQADLDTYLNGVSGPSVTIGKMTLARAGNPIKVNIPFNQCYMYNYLRVSNGTPPITAHYTDGNNIPQTKIETPKTYYYFITSVTYLAPNTTLLTVQLDVWQTFGFDVSFGNCYIAQGHIGIANENAFDNKGRDYLTVAEGLEIGDEYNINKTYNQHIVTNHVPNGQISDADLANLIPPGSPTPWIIMGIAADVEADPGDTESPNLKLNGTLTNTEGLPNGFDILIFTNGVADFAAFKSTFSDTPWITQTIQFITMIPPLRVSNLAGLDPVYFWDITTQAPMTTSFCFRFDSQKAEDSYSMTIADSFRDDAEGFIPDRYSILKKFLVYPYMLVEITTYNASPLILRPELVPSDDLQVDIYQHFAPPSPRWGIVPRHYNATGTGGTKDDGEYLDFATYITNFPQFTMLNDGYMQYLASNAGSIPYAYQNADWSQQKALSGAGADYYNAQAGIVNQKNQAQIQIEANNRRMAVQNIGAIANIGVDIFDGIATRGASVGNLGSDITGFAQRSANNAINNSVVSQGTSSNVFAANEIADTNLRYAQFAAKGDYHNDIAALQARITNAKVTQPTVVGQMNGESFFVTIDGYWKIYAKLKQINPGMMAVIGEYWLRYGYSINRFGRMPASLQVMSKFTYWKLKEAYITSSRCPETFKQTIRGIFEKGVTVWKTPTDIGNIDIGTNVPLTGITL